MQKPAVRARYEVLSTLGSGGFGTVHEAIDTRTGQRVALKELSRTTAAALAAFKQEFRALADIHHGNLVGLRELREIDGRWFIAMELVRGRDLLAFVRAEGLSDNDGTAPFFDAQRLRIAFAGMARGLIALHEHDVLHRDLKPSNVRVTAEGRAVLLDFGLVTSANPNEQSVHAGLVGTASYMAPEQASGKKLGPSIDWYAFGTCLFEALTGRVPFEGDTFKVLLDKTTQMAPRAGSMAASVPAELDGLCAALLEKDPRRRAGASEVLRVFAERTPHSVSVLPPELDRQASGTHFTGRKHELERLEQCFARTRDGALRIALVEGESGVGKTALVHEFLKHKRVQFPNLLVLRGRCYENEQVPYKAFDGCMDQLSRALHRMSSEELKELLPRRATLLAQMFPVLRDVITSAALPTSVPPADPTARRLEAFAALAELFGNLLRRTPLILSIDDLQWADPESFRLLRALVESRSAGGLLLLATIRPQKELEPSVREQMELVRTWSASEVLSIAGLRPEDAAELATSLLGEEASGAFCEAITRESRGHPLLLSELVRYAASHALAPGDSPSLEAALSARIAALSVDARALLELVALAGRPYGSELFAVALDTRDIAALASQLLSERLLRLHGGHELGCFHDRVRGVTEQLLQSSVREQRHRQLASALSRVASADPSELARHWDLCGNRERAIAAYERAGDHALEQLAFVRAEALFGRALVLLGATRDEAHLRLTIRRAEALAQGGRSAEAAPLYREAAELSSGEERVRLTTRSIQQLLRAGQVAEGSERAREHLHTLGVSLPKSTAGALASVAFQRLLRKLRGNAFTVDLSTVPSSEEMLALEAMDQMGLPLQMLDIPLGLALSVNYIRRAAQSGDRKHMARASAVEGWMVTLSQSLEHGRSLFELSRRLSQQEDAVTAAMSGYLEGSARLVTWDFAGALACLDPSYQLAKTRCAGEPWLLTLIRRNLGSLWRLTGEFELLARESEGWILEARERRDSYTIAELTGLGFGHLRHLMRDDPQAALAEIEEAAANIPPERFAYAHLGQIVAMVSTLLYIEPTRAHVWLTAHLEQHGSAFLLRTRFGREILLMMRSFAALDACTVAKGKARERLLSDVRSHVRQMERMHSTFATAYSALVLAQLEVLSGAPHKALAAARSAGKVFADIGHYGAHSASYFEGLLEGGESGKQKRNDAERWYLQRGWRNARNAMVVAMPALGAVELSVTQAPL